MTVLLAALVVAAVAPRPAPGNASLHGPDAFVERRAAMVSAQLAGRRRPVS